MKDSKFLIIILVLFSLLSFSCKDIELTATWDPNAEPDMSHYNVYGYYQANYHKINDDPIVHPMQSYTFSLELPDDFEEPLCVVVTAVDTSGNESNYSDMVCVDE